MPPGSTATLHPPLNDMGGRGRPPCTGRSALGFARIALLSCTVSVSHAGSRLLLLHTRLPAALGCGLQR